MTSELDLLNERLRCAERARDDYKIRAQVAEGKERNRVFNDLTKTPTDHLDRFFAHPCRDRIVRLFPNAKEVTESFGAFHAVNTRLTHLDRADPNVTVLVVGDGHSPRTGMLFAVSSAWGVWSIDPQMRLKYRGLHERLNLIDAKIEDVHGWNLPLTKVVIIGVHSHATLEASIKKVRACARLDVVSIPCCVPQYIPFTSFPGPEFEHDGLPLIAPDFSYEDRAILSPERTVLGWLDLTEKARVEAGRRR